MLKYASYKDLQTFSIQLTILLTNSVTPLYAQANLSIHLHQKNRCLEHDNQIHTQS